MNIALWILQIVMALHTAAGAVWKFSHSAEQTMPSLKAIPRGVWLSMSVLEIACAACLILAGFYEPLAVLVPAAAIVVGLEMLAFCGMHLASGGGTFGPMIYWLVVAVVMAFIAYGRLALSPF